MRMSANGFLVCLLLVSTLAMAHHGTGGTYDMDKPITLKGTVTEFRFTNPHVLILFDVSDAKGTVNWLAEGPSVINWTRTGWNRTTLKAKDHVTITLYPARSGKREGVIHKVITGSGKEWCCETK